MVHEEWEGTAVVGFSPKLDFLVSAGAPTVSLESISDGVSAKSVD